MKDLKIGNVARLAALAVLGVAIAGPWAYTLDGVPPPEWCREPLFLLENGRCAATVSGAWMAMTSIGWAISGLAGLAAVADRWREYTFILLFLGIVIVFLLPGLTTLFQVFAHPGPRRRKLHLAAWSLAGGLCGLFLVLDINLRSGRFWGVWLYLGLAALVLAFELSGLSLRRRKL